MSSPGRARVIEPDGVADLVRDGVAQVVDVESPSNPIFHGWRGLRQMSERSITFLPASPAFRVTLVKARPMGSACAPIRMSARVGVTRLAEAEVGDRLPHAEGRGDLVAELVGR